MSWHNCTPLRPSRGDDHLEGDRVFVLVAMTTATLGLLLNLSQVAVILRQGLLRHHKNLVVLNLCVTGQISSATVLWYIHRVVSFWRNDLIVDDYLLCFLLPSGMHLLTLFTCGPLITLLVLQHHLVASPKTPRRLLVRRHLLVALLVVVAWCEALLISLMPLTGWNSWNEVCSFPMAWSPSFSVLIVVLYFLHYPIVIILLADLCLWSPRRRGTVAPEPPGDVSSEESLCRPTSQEVVQWDESRKELCTTLQVERDLGTRNCLLLFLLYAAGTAPFMCLVAKTALHSDGDPCQSLVANEKVAMWTSWMTSLFAALRPLFHVLVEEDLGDATAIFITTVCRFKNINT